jgi:hypothetical protein
MCTGGASRLRRRPRWVREALAARSRGVWVYVWACACGASRSFRHNVNFIHPVVQTNSVYYQLCINSLVQMPPGCHLRASSLGSMGVRINPITLRLDDEEMERELRAGTIDASYYVLNLFFLSDIVCRSLFPVCNIMFDPNAETGLIISYTCIATTYATVLFNFRRVYRLPRHDAAAFVDRVWMASFAANVAVWWAMQACGLARRLSADEGTGAAVCCGMWAFVLVIQHTLHIGFWPRLVVMLMPVSIALTSPAWQKQMLVTLMFGEVSATRPPSNSRRIRLLDPPTSSHLLSPRRSPPLTSSLTSYRLQAIGYSMEHMMRSSYLPRAKSLEQMRVAKERSDMDFQMLAHSRARGSPSPVNDPLVSLRSGRGGSSSGSSSVNSFRSPRSRSPRSGRSNSARSRSSANSRSSVNTARSRSTRSSANSVCSRSSANSADSELSAASSSYALGQSGWI